MVNYDKIYKLKLYGTMKFCIEHFKQDFYNTTNTSHAITIANEYNDINIIYDLHKNPYVDKVNLIKRILLTKYSRKIIQEDLLKNDIIPYNTIDKHKNARYLPSILEKLLQFVDELDYSRLHRYVLKLYNDKRFPKSGLKKVFKQIPLNDKQATIYLYSLLKSYNGLEIANLYMRTRKPEIKWKTLFSEYSIQEKHYYKITTIINSMRHYKSVLISYDEMKKTFIIPMEKEKIPSPKKIYKKYLKQRYSSEYNDLSLESVMNSSRWNNFSGV